jgi:hypothetical protein
MIKDHKFWSNRISLVVIGTLDLYLAAAYFIITVL